MTSAQVDKTLLTTTDNSPSQNYNIVITRVNQQYLHLKESERDSFAKRDMVATGFELGFDYLGSICPFRLFLGGHFPFLRVA